MINLVAMTITGFCGVAVIGVSLVGPYDNLKQLAARCDKVQSDMQAQIKHRHAMAADLLELVRSASTHSNEAFESASRAHTAVTSGNAADEEHFAQALGKLIDMLKDAPEFAANPRFQELVQDLAKAEALMGSIQRFHDKTFEQYSAQRNSPVGKLLGLFGADGRKRDSGFSFKLKLNKEQGLTGASARKV